MTKQMTDDEVLMKRLRTKAAIATASADDPDYEAATLTIREVDLLDRALAEALEHGQDAGILRVAAERQRDGAVKQLAEARAECELMRADLNEPDPCGALRKLHARLMAARQENVNPMEIEIRELKEELAEARREVERLRVALDHERDVCSHCGSAGYRRHCANCCNDTAAVERLETRLANALNPFSSTEGQLVKIEDGVTFYRVRGEFVEVGRLALAR